MKLSELIEEEMYAAPRMAPEDVAAAIAARLHECVKPLVWIDDSKEDYSVFDAEGIANLGYYVADYPDGSWGWFTSFKTEQRYSGLQCKTPTLEAAKAAAQAHNAAQIIAGLDL